MSRLVSALAGAAVLGWVVFLRGHVAAGALVDSDQSNAMETEEMSSQGAILLPTGGPFVTADKAVSAASDFAVRRGATPKDSPKARLLTYADAVRLNRTGWNPQVHAGREIYLVSINGQLAVHKSRGVLVFNRSFYVIDATSGEVLDWGATDLPDPLASASRGAK